MPGPLKPPSEPIDDPFAFCNHVAWQVGGPVLIHDSEWGVFAYSTLNQPIDETRRSIILRREVPSSDVETHTIRTAQQHLDAGVEAFEIPAYEGLQTRRVVAPIRMLGVLVGSLWVAESAGPLHPDALAMVRHAAKQASLYFQLHEDRRRREADRFARMLLEGTQEESLLAAYLGVPVTTRFRVVAVWHGADTELREQVRQVARVLAAQHPVDSIVLDGDECAYVTFYADDLSALTHVTRSFARDMTAADGRILAGGGRTTNRLAHVPKSRADADRVISYLRRNPGQRAGSVNTLKSQIALMRLVEILDSQFEPLPDGLKALGPLEPEDREEALRTLDAYFTHPGNASEAARQLHVHPNTFRYRLAKVADILGVDLDDRDARLILELELLRLRYST